MELENEDSCGSKDARGFDVLETTELPVNFPTEIKASPILTIVTHMSCAPTSHCWGHPYSISLLVIWTGGCSRFANWVGALVCLEGRKAQKRDLDRLDPWAEVNCLCFSQVKCLVITTPCSVTSCGQSSWKAALQKRIWGC